MIPHKQNVPSLESLVNQCCEDYYYKISNDTEQKPLQKIPSSSPYSSGNFKQFILGSHCMENLKFLMEIYHYEKIWNKIFKRQSSILKCKEEPSRKQSVVNSLRGRKHSIMEDSIKSFNEDKEEREKLNEHIAVTHSHSHSSINLNINLSLPNVIESGKDFDTRSFVDQDHVLSTSPVNHNTRNHEVWDSLFKPSYFDKEQTSLNCLCNEGDVDEGEYNESLQQSENREALKVELSEKFNYIVDDFVKDNSPYEINLPDDVYTKLIEEAQNNKILFHSPLTLLPAKNAVLQLLRENIYYKFLSQQERSQVIKETKVTREEAPRSLTSRTASSPSVFIPPPPIKSATFDSLESDKSISSDEKQPLASLLNKYHLKIHHNDSNSNLATSTTSPSNSSPSTESLRPKARSKTFSSNDTYLHHDVHYMKGPCGIAPNISAYDPQPPLQTKGSNWGTKLFKFRRKKKEEV